MYICQSRQLTLPPPCMAQLQWIPPVPHSKLAQFNVRCGFNHPAVLCLSRPDAMARTTVKHTTKQCVHAYDASTASQH